MHSCIKTHVCFPVEQVELNCWAMGGFKYYSPLLYNTYVNLMSLYILCSGLSV